MKKLVAVQVTGLVIELTWTDLDPLPPRQWSERRIFVAGEANYCEAEAKKFRDLLAAGTAVD
jgi:hypothetical protein